MLTPFEFLSYIRPDGPWDLISNGSEMRTVHSKNEVEIFLSAYASTNIYYLVNEPKDGLENRRKRKKHMSTANFLYADIDPRIGRTLEDIIHSLEEFEPEPSVIISTGGGCQALWRIQSVDISEKDNQDLVEAKGKALSLLLNGDSVHAINHILRLPGTTNYPTQAKIKRGQVERKAEIIKFNPELIYNVNDFQGTVSERLSIDFDWVPPKGQVDIPENALDNVPLKVHDELLAEHPIGTRSEVVFYVVCTLIEFDISPDWIYTILLDKSLPISSYVYIDNTGAYRRNPEQIAARQVERGIKYVAEKSLQEPKTLEELSVEDGDDDDADASNIRNMFNHLNRNYAKVENFGNHCRILVLPRTQREPYGFLPVNDFLNSASHLNIVERNSDKEKIIRVPKLWLDHRRGRRYRRVEFAPGKELEPDIFNMWRGFNFEPVQGDWFLFQTFIKSIICNNNEDYYNYIIKWMASAVQKMDEPAQSAIILYGARGVGKSFLPEMFGKLFGRHYRQTQNPFDKFNGTLSDTVLLFGDEVSCKTTAQANRLKIMVTEKWLEVEYKGVEKVNTNNCLHIILSTNDETPIPVGIDERRYFVLRIDRSAAESKEYYDATARQLENGGYSAMLYDLLSEDIVNFDSQRDMPNTEFLAEQKLRSATPMMTWWHEILVRGVIEADWPTQISKELIYANYASFCESYNYNCMPREVFHADLKRVVPKLIQKRLRQGENRERVYEVPNLHECRMDWTINTEWD